MFRNIIFLLVITGISLCSSVFGADMLENIRVISNNTETDRKSILSQIYLERSAIEKELLLLSEKLSNMKNKEIIWQSYEHNAISIIHMVGISDYRLLDSVVRNLLKKIDTPILMSSIPVGLEIMGDSLYPFYETITLLRPRPSLITGFLSTCSDEKIEYAARVLVRINSVDNAISMISNSKAITDEARREKIIDIIRNRKL